MSAPTTSSAGLVELAVRNLGVIEDIRLALPGGMVALTGETGAGKTLVVEAIELLVGGRADAAIVRPGAEEAWIEGRFVARCDGGEETEVVLSRVVPASGRSRGYVDGRLATVGALAEWGQRLVDLHGQHAHQSLLGVAAQREALDRFAGIDLGALRAARGRIQEIDRQLGALGGDDQARAREADLLRYQLEEIDAAALSDPGEDESLAAEEDRLASAAAHREAAAAAAGALGADGGALDAVGVALAALGGRGHFAAVEAQLRGAAAELADAASELRRAGEAIAEDPERLEAVRSRRQLLRNLRRKYGDSLAEVMAFASRAGARLAALEDHDRRAAELDRARERAREALGREAAAVAAARRQAAPRLAAAVGAHLAELAMPRARLAVEVVGAPPADDVRFHLAANPGGPPLPLARVASGGELARAMLALRLVLTTGPPTLVFDEVDAGIGGEAAIAVGRSLAALGSRRQTLVVTHLPQVAAFADAHVRVTKRLGEDRASCEVELLDAAGRVVELSRMLSGQPGSSTAQDHAAELLSAASQARGR